jgi:plastocyanin
MALLLLIVPLITIELKSEAYAHAYHIHQTREQTAFAQRAAEITPVEFGGALGFAYSPQHAFILPGDTIRWLGDFAMHPLVSDDGLWQQVASGTEFNFTFDQPGRYEYHCASHDELGMNGSVTVGEAYFLPVVIN